MALAALADEDEDVPGDARFVRIRPHVHVYADGVLVGAGRWRKPSPIAPGSSFFRSS